VVDKKDEAQFTPVEEELFVWHDGRIIICLEDIAVMKLFLQLLC